MFPVLVFRTRPVPFRSCTAANAVTSASTNPSGTSSPSAVVTASVYMWSPTFRTRREAPAGQHELAPLDRLVDPVRVEPPRHRLQVLAEGRLEGALHDPEPVPVDAHLVLGVHGRDRVLAVLDRREGRLEGDVADAGRVRGANGVLSVDPDLDVEAVVAEKDGAEPVGGPPEPDEAARVAEARLAPLGQPNQQRAALPVPLERVGDHVSVASLPERDDLVEERPAPRDHPGSPGRVVGGGRVPGPVLLPLLAGNHVRAVEGVVEAAPARVRGVQRVAGVVDGDDELRSGERADLGVHVLGRDAEGLRLGEEVARRLEVRAVGTGVPRLARPLAVPAIEPRLMRGSDVEEPPVLGGELRDDAAEGLPHRVRIEPRAGRNLVAHQLVEQGRDLETAATYKGARAHGFSPGRSPGDERDHGAGTRSAESFSGDPHAAARNPPAAAKP